MESPPATVRGIAASQALEKLAEGALRANPEGAWQLFDQAWPALDARILTFVRSLRLAQEFREDCGQNTFLRVWRGRETYRGNCLDEFYAWVYRITRNEAMRLVDKADRSARREADTRDPVPLDELSQVNPSDSTALQEQEEARALEECMDGLDERSRSLVDLLYGENSSSERAAASMLEISKSYVNTLRQAALVSLKNCLEGKGVEA